MATQRIVESTACRNPAGFAVRSDFNSRLISWAFKPAMSQ